MFEFHYLPATTKKLTKENLSKLNCSIVFDDAGYSISADNGVIYGFSNSHEALSLYPGRSEGKWLELLKNIDENIVNIEVYDDDFLTKINYGDYSIDVLSKMFADEVDKNRKKLGLNELIRN